MKLLKTFIAIAVLFLSLNFGFSQVKSGLLPQFNGYMQIRAYSDLGTYYNFSVRRLKLWIKSSPDNSHWSYKIQTTFSSRKNEQFFLQDVKIGYKTANFTFNIGQFVPQFSLQRFQPDYRLPVIERADVIKCLIPDGTLGVRDLGIQVGWHNSTKTFNSFVGVFNGYGIKKFRFKNQGFLITHKTYLNLKLNQLTVKTGYSLQFRRAKDLQLPKILPDTVLFNGNDLRFNLFLMLKSPAFHLQTEYIRAFLNQKIAYGYYVLAAYKIKKSQFVAAYGKYYDLISSTDDLPNFRLGYNYLINGDKIKLSFDNYFKLLNNRPENYQFSIQLQVFLH